jgi:hypothetical protein
MQQQLRTTARKASNEIPGTLSEPFSETAKTAGATVLMPVAEQFWGDRYGLLEDPFGHRWAVDTPGEPKSMEEMQEAMKVLAE